MAGLQSIVLQNGRRTEEGDGYRTEDGVHVGRNSDGMAIATSQLAQSTEDGSVSFQDVVQDSLEQTEVNMTKVADAMMSDALADITNMSAVACTVQSLVNAPLSPHEKRQGDASDSVYPPQSSHSTQGIMSPTSQSSSSKGRRRGRSLSLRSNSQAARESVSFHGSTNCSCSPSAPRTESSHQSASPYSSRSTQRGPQRRSISRDSNCPERKCAATDKGGPRAMKNRLLKTALSRVFHEYGKESAPFKGARRQVCWHGRECKRQDCWFSHPDGRRIDRRYCRSLPKRRESERRLRSPSRRRRSPVETKRRRCSPPSLVVHSPSPAASVTSASPITSRSSAKSNSPESSRQSSRPDEPSPRCASTKSNSPKSSRQSSRPDEPSPRCASAVASVALASASPIEAKPITENMLEVPMPVTSTFRDFILNEMDDFATLDDAMAQYSAHQQGVLQKVVERLRLSGLLFDLYNPAALARESRRRVDNVCRLSDKFAKELTSRQFEGLRLVADSNSPIVRDGVCRATGHLCTPHFAFDSAINSIRLSDIPATISVWDIFDHLRSQPGFISTSAGRCSDVSFLRSCHALFETDAQAKAVVATLSNLKLNDFHKVRSRVLDPAATLEAFMLPPMMSAPERIAKDMNLSAQVVRKLDSFLGVSPEITAMVLTPELPCEIKLDLQLLYLRRVHHFCYYSCQWCSDEWELHDRCGAAILRSNILVLDATVTMGQTWVEAHDNRIQEFLATASFQQSPFPSVSEEPVKSFFEAQVDKNMIEAAPQKFQCLQCKKYFRAREYVRKHLLKVHPEIADATCREACIDIAATSCLADPSRLGWTRMTNNTFAKLTE